MKQPNIKELKLKKILYGKESLKRWNKMFDEFPKMAK